LFIQHFKRQKSKVPLTNKGVIKMEETIKCRDLRDKWETKGVKLEPKTIDEILDLYGFNSDSLKANIEQYENQRVIDELERIKKECSKVGSRYITWCVLKEGIDKRIKQLKQ